MAIGMRNVLGLAVGAAAAVGVDRVTEQLAPARRMDGAALGLLTAAGIYPAARRRGFGTASEKLVLTAAAVVVAAAAALPARRAQLLAAGWVAHAGFDALFTPHVESRIPSWYPAVCAGYDLALGVRLLT
jgi:hypothetical protein